LCIHLFSLYSSAHTRSLPSFPTRRSSDLEKLPNVRQDVLGSEDRTELPRGASFSTAQPFVALGVALIERRVRVVVQIVLEQLDQDRKSTRLNSSHVSISYAVFCLKKKNKN